MSTTTNDSMQVHVQLIALGLPERAAERLAGMVFELESIQSQTTRALADLKRDTERMMVNNDNGARITFDAPSLQSRVNRVRDLGTEQEKALESLTISIATVADFSGIKREVIREIIFR
jgi:hypothetical protein